MTSGGAITTAVDKIANALAIYTLSVRFAEACESGVIPPQALSRPVNIITGGDGIALGAENFTKQKLVDQSFNLMLMALGHSSLITDEALDATFGAKDPLDLSNRGALRAIIYQIRNAFAHGPLAPHWSVKSKYAQKYTVRTDGVQIDCDFRALNGTPVMLDHVGGLEGYVRLLKEAQVQVA